MRGRHTISLDNFEITAAAHVFVVRVMASMASNSRQLEAHWAIKDDIHFNGCNGFRLHAQTAIQGSKPCLGNPQTEKATPLQYQCFWPRLRI